MGKKDKDYDIDPLDEFEKLQNEIIADKIKKIFRDRSRDFVTALEELGFVYCDDEEDYEYIEEMEEKAAQPQNDNQRILVNYFAGQRELTKDIFEIFVVETEAEDTNYPLIRRYFKQGNNNLKNLILYGLDNYPSKIDLLNDLAFFHEFKNIIDVLIKYYTRACLQQEDLQTFSELARDFYFNTCPDGYDAYQALRELFAPYTEKRKIIDFLISEEETTYSPEQSITIH